MLGLFAANFCALISHPGTLVPWLIGSLFPPCPPSIWPQMHHKRRSGQFPVEGKGTADNRKTRKIREADGQRMTPEDLNVWTPGLPRMSVCLDPVLISISNIWKIDPTGALLPPTPAPAWERPLGGAHAGQT